MKEIGGYIELEKFIGEIIHKDAIALNCGRNALAYLLEAKKIEKIAMPYFMCDSCERVLDAYGVDVRYYHIQPNFLPEDFELKKDEWIYIVNFYGQLTNDVLSRLQKKYKKIIVDNAQSYFQKPLKNIDTLYTCRKFFGVSDGAFLYTDKYLERKLEIDESHERMHFLLGRYERNASEFYMEYVENNELFNNQPIKRMSKLTNNFLHAINYKETIKKRTDNYKYLWKIFKNINILDLIVPYGAFMYPLYVANGEIIRKKLQGQKIYIPTLWPNVLENCTSDSLEYNYAKNILPLPVDQRYGIDDMAYMVEEIKRYIDN